ncbi:MAG: hypothetical protein AAFP70_08110 [Calditrichota bacterium]
MNEFTLKTRRLALRKLQVDDMEELQQLWALPEVRKYLWDDKIVLLA